MSHEGVTEFIISKGCNIEARDHQEWTPLFWVALKGHQNTEAKDSRGWTPLHWSSTTNNTQVVEILLGAKKDGSSGLTTSKLSATKRAAVSISAGCFGCYVTCPNAVSSRVIHLIFHRYQHNYSSSLDSIKLVY
jgi:ankyrin repeat protein